MELILIIVVLLLLFGGGGGYWGRVEASGEATRLLLPRRETNGTFVTLALDVADELGSAKVWRRLVTRRGGREQPPALQKR